MAPGIIVAPNTPGAIYWESAWDEARAEELTDSVFYRNPVPSGFLTLIHKFVSPADGFFCSITSFEHGRA